MLRRVLENAPPTKLIAGSPDNDEMDSYAIQLSEFLYRKEALIMALQAAMYNFPVSIN
jgi:hypothetical protein